jgi:hypothetical protein
VLAVGPFDGVGKLSSSASRLNQNRQPRQRTIWLFRAWDPAYDQHALLSHCIAAFCETDNAR